KTILRSGGRSARLSAASYKYRGSCSIWATNKRIAAHMQHRCPICKTPADSAVHAEFPFCSERCRLQDLGNWASEKYVVSEPIFDEDDGELNELPEPPDHDDDKR